MSLRSFLPVLSLLFLCGASLASAKAPIAPSNLRVTPQGVNSFKLEWNDNSIDETGWEIRVALKGTTPQRYQMLAQAADGTAAKGANSYTVITNDLPGKELLFQIASYNGATGLEIISQPTSIVTARALSPITFGAPIKFKVVTGDGDVRLIWKDMATSEHGYQLQFKLASKKKWKSLGTILPGTTFKIPASGFRPNTSYSFRVRAFKNNPARFTAFSSVVTVKTLPFQAPSDFLAVAESEGAFSFKWKDRSSIEGGYELQKKTGTGEFISLGTVSANQTSTTPVSGFALNTAHQFRIRGYRVVGETKVYSAFSNLVSIKSTLLARPTNVAGTALGESSIKVTWKDASIRETGYEVEYREVGTTPFTTVTVASNVQTATVTQLKPGRLYEFRLRSSLNDWFSSSKSAYTALMQVRTKDGIEGDLNPPIFWDTSFLYPIQVSRASALTGLTVTGLPAGLTYDSGTRTISGSATVEGVKTVTLRATFSDASVVTRNLVLRIIRPAAAPIVAQAFDSVNVDVDANSVVSVNDKFADPDTLSAARFVTPSGTIDIILYSLATPNTVDNFIDYLDAGHYTDSFFHRSVADATRNLSIIQGGGYQHTSATGFTRISKFPAVQNEPGISNLKGTVAMAKVAGNPHSATSEFFVNVNDLNASNLDQQNEGFTVFGRVSEPSLAVVEEINALTRKNYTVTIGSGSQALEDVPITTESAATTIDPALLVKFTAGAAPILSYEVLSAAPAIATASLVGTDITITGMSSGTTTVEVKATDLDGQTVTQEIAVTVP